MRAISPIAKVGIISVIGFIAVNAYVSYLGSRINPFVSPIPLWREGYSEKFELGVGTFHSTSYVLVLALSRPNGDEQSELRRWGPELEEQLRREFDVEVRIDLRDSGGRNLIFHNGDLTRWRLTPTPYVENGIGTFSNYRFD